MCLVCKFIGPNPPPIETAEPLSEEESSLVLDALVGVVDNKYDLAHAQRLVALDYYGRRLAISYARLLSNRPLDYTA